ncbi:hypothetical protein [Niastella caeni]|uniref:hypothetical protein n=1 Tax=Niastella caeni TaxID=2569763 RepID=UPI00129ACDEE|nr:hypothetical protein [Niastella caeni]
MKQELRFSGYPPVDFHYSHGFGDYSQRNSGVMADFGFSLHVFQRTFDYNQ